MFFVLNKSLYYFDFVSLFVSELNIRTLRTGINCTQVFNIPFGISHAQKYLRNYSDISIDILYIEKTPFSQNKTKENIYSRILKES